MQSRYRSGFTLVEILIAITIMVILTTLAVVALSSNQADARDSERKADAETLARGMEEFYKVGFPKYNIPPGTYPGVALFFHADGWDKPEIGPQANPSYFETGFIPGVDRSAMYITGVPGRAFGIINFWGVPAEDDANINSSVTKDTIKYEPISFLPADGWGPDRWSICNVNCSRFNIYYRTEKDNVVHKISSLHQ